MTTETYHWGNDPAFKTSGIVVLNQDHEVMWSKVMDFSIEGFSKTLDCLPIEKFPPKTIVFERFVSYGPATTKFSEYILMGLGATMDRTRMAEQFFFRAIDWKTALVKREFREKQYVNPSKTLDKKFSKSMAFHLTGHIFKTDHEADAACLAAIGIRSDYSLKPAPFETSD